MLSGERFLFQHLGDGMWARSFRQDATMPPGNGTFLIRSSRPGFGLCLKCCSSGQMCLRLYLAEGREREQAALGQQGFALVWMWGSVNLVGRDPLPAGCLSH